MDQTDVRSCYEAVTQSQPDAGLAVFAPVLPIETDSLVTTTEGNTPVVACPSLSDNRDVGTVRCKDEGQNPTGGIQDREMAVAVGGAIEDGAGKVWLPTTGNGGQSAAAYAAHAGIDSESFVPSRTTFENKAMINVHGGEMNVVGGRYADALEAFEDARTDADESEWYSLAPFETHHRQEGIKTVAYELVAQGDTVPDAVVYPTGHGLGVVGLARGFRELVEAGVIESMPRLYAAQPEGCAPIVEAFEEDIVPHGTVEYPDTICGTLEIPDPAGGEEALAALTETDGGVVAPTDEQLLEAATALAGNGIPVSATGGVAAAGVSILADAGEFSEEETVSFVNPAAANREADILRSHLMRKGI